MFSRMSKVNLRDYQVDNYHKLLNVLDKNYFYIDNSMMGRGKTHVTSKIAEDLGLPVVVVCFDEISSNMVWKKALDNYDIEYYYGMNNKPLIIPYSQLISTGSCQPKHGMLQKIINIFHTRDKKEVKQTIFTATPFLKAIIEQGCFFIFDEFHSGKNSNTNTAKAANVFFKEVCDSFFKGGLSRIAVLSGTLLRRDREYATYMKTFNFITDDYLYRYNIGTKQYSFNGIFQLIAHGDRLNMEESRKFVEENIDTILNPTNEKIIDYVVNYFEDVLAPVIRSAMKWPDSFYEKSDQRIENIFLPMTEEESIEYSKAVMKLSLATAFDPCRNSVNLSFAGSALMGQLYKSLEEVQKSKVNSVVRFVKKIFQSDYYRDGERVTPKVIIYGKFNSVIESLVIQLLDHSPLVMTGAVSKKLRPVIIDKFQQHDDEYRLLISNVKIASQSIDIHDTHGNFPRIVFIMADYEIINMQQIFGRYLRDGCNSNSVCYIVYGEVMKEIELSLNLSKKGKQSNGIRENKLINAIHRSKNTIQRFNKDQGDDLKMPGDYPEIHLDKVIPLAPEGIIAVPQETSSYSFCNDDHIFLPT